MGLLAFFGFVVVVVVVVVSFFLSFFLFTVFLSFFPYFFHSFFTVGFVSLFFVTGNTDGGKTWFLQQLLLMGARGRRGRG